MPELQNGGRPNSSLDGGASTSRNELVSALFRANNRALIGFLMTHLTTESEAREVAQEAYVKLLQLDQPEAISFLRTYLFRIAGNLAIDRIRRRSRKERIDRLDLFDDHSHASSVEDEVMAQQDLQFIRKVVAELKPNYHVAFALHKFRDHSIAEIATAMNITPRMVRVYVARAVFYCRLRLDGSSPEAAYQAMMELQS
jgi:RNA polymerase sigma factor (sigma-70 family)